MDFQRMIRKDGYKLLVYPKINKILLFDLENDPEEINDLADKQEYNSKVKNLLKELIELQKTMGDELRLQSIYDDFLKTAP